MLLLLFLVRSSAGAFQQQLRRRLPYSRRCWTSRRYFASPTTTTTTNTIQNATDEDASTTATTCATTTVLDDDDAAIRAQTLRWVKDVVIGLQLCPFASAPLLAGRLHVRVVRTMQQQQDVVETELQHAMEHLQQQQQGGTTLVVCPDLFPNDFDAFWTQVVQPLETEWLVQQGWEGIFQLAPFHPQFRFAGSSSSDDDDENSPDQFTNRSPYPMLHVLREADVTRAVADLRTTTNDDTTTTTITDPSYAVWSRNVDLLRTLADELTPEEFTAVVTACRRRRPVLRDKVRSILQRFRCSKE